MELKTTPEYLQTIIAELETVNKELKSSNKELQIINEQLVSNNSELQSKVNELTYANDNVTVYFISQIKDITERKQLEQDRQRLYELAQQDARIKAELLDEVNHRVKNNLVRIQSILQMQQQKHTNQSNVQSVLVNIQNRIDGMLTVHTMLSRSQWQPLELGDLIRQITEGVIGGSSIHNNIKLDCSFEPPSGTRQMVVSNQATALALILNELATNSIKYAFTDRTCGHIEVRVFYDEELHVLKLIFCDDGSGWPDDVLTGQRQGVGLQLIRGAVRSLPNSKLELINNCGAMTILTFKLAKNVPD